MTSVTIPAPPVGRPTGWWGMLMVLATEGALFAILLASYFYLRFRSPGAWPPGGHDDPAVLIPLVMTALLLLSSVTVHGAELGIRSGDQRRLRLGVALTLLLGAAFLALQALEYHEELRDVTPRTDAYGSIFYTVTGLHGAHVMLGLLLLLWTQFFAWRGAYAAERHVAVQVTALYWHFIPVVWVLVFLTLYVSPRL
jgi:heme/copper-type cytochrome/quinol oxidase subunit 3